MVDSARLFRFWINREVFLRMIVSLNPFVVALLVSRARQATLDYAQAASHWERRKLLEREKVMTAQIPTVGCRLYGAYISFTPAHKPPAYSRHVCSRSFGMHYREN